MIADIQYLCILVYALLFDLYIKKINMKNLSSIKDINTCD